MQAGSGIAANPRGRGQAFETLVYTAGFNGNPLIARKPFIPIGCSSPVEGLPPKKMVGQTFSRCARTPSLERNRAGFLTGRQGIRQLKPAFNWRPAKHCSAPHPRL